MLSLISSVLCNDSMVKRCPLPRKKKLKKTKGGGRGRGRSKMEDEEAKDNKDTLNKT